MKIRLMLAPLALCAATPVLATSTLECRSTISPADGPQLWLSIGNSPSGIVSARFAYGNQRFATGEGARAPVIAQSWVDRNSLRLVVMDANAETALVHLETWSRTGATYAGTLRAGGRSWRVRCSEEG